MVQKTVYCIHTSLAFRIAGIVQTRNTAPIPVKDTRVDKMIAIAK